MTESNASKTDDDRGDFVRGVILLSRRLERLEEERFSKALGLKANLKFEYPDAMVASGVISVGGIDATLMLERGRVDEICLDMQWVPKGAGAALVAELQELVMTALDQIGFPREEATGRFEAV